MRKSLSHALLVLLFGSPLLVSQLGCEMPEIEDPPAPVTVTEEEEPAPEPGSSNQSNPGTSDQSSQGAKNQIEGTTDTKQETQENSTDPGVAREVTAKDPRRGKKSRAAGGYLGAVFSTRFWAEHKMTFNVIKKNMDLYNAEHGNYPKSHEEFMEKIIRTNQVKLPELDEGQEYIYTPDDHTLKFRATGSEPGESTETAAP